MLHVTEAKYQEVQKKQRWTFDHLVATCLAESPPGRRSLVKCPLIRLPLAQVSELSGFLACRFAKVCFSLRASVLSRAPGTESEEPLFKLEVESPIQLTLSKICDVESATAQSV